MSMESDLNQSKTSSWKMRSMSIEAAYALATIDAARPPRPWSPVRRQARHADGRKIGVGFQGRDILKSVEEG
ncbi:unnamed protein product, partial [Iphiclides podalirius]